MKERDRLAALGSMAAGLAHEVKNPLGAIKGAAQLLEEVAQSSKEQDPTTNEFLGIILEETDRLNRVVASFLDYARPHAGNPVPLDINAAVRRSCQILNSQKSDGGDVEIRLELGEVLPVSIDPEKLRQVLMNLVQNAIQAMNNEGKVTITTGHRRAPRSAWVTSPPSGNSGRLPPDEVEVVEISVSDTGPGISQKVLKNLFVPFFTTKEQGTGLGLAISQSIVQNAGGSIQVQSQQGSGSKFTITLPASDSGPLPTPVPSMAPPTMVADGE
jgi:signal transduction histidine kinase